MNQEAVENLESQTPDQPQSAPSEQSQAQAAIDLDGVSEFTFQGQKLTPDQLLEIMNGYKTLSESQKSYAQEQKFIENLEADLDNVMKDPSLAQKFKEIYPPKFHPLVDKILRSSGQASAAQPNSAQNALPQELQQKFMTLEQRLKFFEDRAYQAEVASAQAQIDKITEPLFKKFPLAIEDQVFARAEAYIEKGHKLTEKVWERLIRESHETIEKRFDQVNGAKLKAQIEKGKRGADVGPGGATPGQAPMKAKTLEEAREQMLKAFAR